MDVCNMNNMNNMSNMNNINRLDAILKKTNTPNDQNNSVNIDTEIDIKSIIKKLKKKFSQLENCEFREQSKIKVSESIRYVDKDMTKVSIIGIVTHVEHYSYIDDNSKIKSIHLSNPYTKTTWKINPDNYYLFKVYRMTNEMKGTKEMHDIIQKYLAGLQKN